MAENSHIRGEKKGKFCACAVSGGSCECGNNFQATGKPSWGWPSQAHHLLPCSCVNAEILGKHGIQGVLRSTTWCINAKANMLGMPTWGHTVQWYCVIQLSTATFRFMSAARGAPPWENLPQHLVDHDLYNVEVSGRLRSVAIGWEVQDHKVKANEIAGDLKGLSDTMLTDLKERGERNGGTHSCWMEAKRTQGQHPGWYEPFSMSDTPREKPFPGRVSDTIESIIKRLTS
jgi:hypothetical protein